jgi:hypothetical protein
MLTEHHLAALFSPTDGLITTASRGRGQVSSTRW